MATTLVSGHTYRAALNVKGWKAAFAQENDIYKAFAESGFTDVHVYRNKPAGWSQPDGAQWYVQGTWGRETLTTDKVSDKADIFGVQDMTPEPPKPEPPKEEPPKPPSSQQGDPPKAKIPSPSSDKGSVGSHKWARNVLIQQWTANAHGVPLTIAALQIVQGIGLMEGGYGFATNPPGWNGSNNWGAQQVAPNADGTCPVGTFPAEDFNGNTGKKYGACIKKYATPELGAADLIREVTKTPEEQKALASGSIDKVSRAMLHARYYTTELVQKPGESAQSLEDRRVKHRSEFVERGIRTIAKALGEPVEATREGFLPDEEVTIGKTVMAVGGLVLSALALRELNHRRNS